MSKRLVQNSTRLVKAYLWLQYVRLKFALLPLKWWYRRLLLEVRYRFDLLRLFFGWRGPRPATKPHPAPQPAAVYRSVRGPIRHHHSDN